MMPISGEKTCSDEFEFERSVGFGELKVFTAVQRSTAQLVVLLVRFSHWFQGESRRVGVNYTIKTLKDSWFQPPEWKQIYTCQRPIRLLTACILTPLSSLFKKVRSSRIDFLCRKRLLVIFETDRDEAWQQAKQVMLCDRRVARFNTWVKKHVLKLLHYT